MEPMKLVLVAQVNCSSHCLARPSAAGRQVVNTFKSAWLAERTCD